MRKLIFLPARRNGRRAQLALYEMLPSLQAPTSPDALAAERYAELARTGRWRTLDGTVVNMRDMTTDHMENTVAKYHRDELHPCVTPCIEVMEVVLELRSRQKREALAEIKKRLHV